MQLLLWSLLSVCASAQTPHPLDPLTASELASAVSVVKSSRGAAELYFPHVVLKEPPKSEVLAWKDGSPFRREAWVVAYDRPKNLLSEGVVDLKARRLLSWTPRPGLQPNVMLSEFDGLPKVVKADPRFRSAMQRRGLDPDKVWIDLWAPGPLSEDERKSGKRLLRGLLYSQEGNTNPYAHPIEGVSFLLDAGAAALLELSDAGVVAVSTAPGDFDEAGSPPRRPGLKPLEISQPEGPSFTLEGRRVRWQNWDFRFALLPREGPVLYQVGWTEGGRVRPVLYRAALSEMLVPYGDPDPNWSWRNAFDEGEYGVGRWAGPLEPGKDAPENAVLLDADFADDHGKPYTTKNALALYERDAGLLWKHLDLLSGKNESRRARELVLTFVATVANYDYQLSWVFRQDGSLALEAGLTGLMLAKGVPSGRAGAGDPHGHAHAHMVAPGVAAPHHQHFFNFRLDLDVDGTENRVVEHNVRSAPEGKGNPLSNVMIMEETRLRKESEAKRSLDMGASRKWRVESASAKNALGAPTGYTLIAGENSTPYLLPSSPMRRKGRFIERHFHATRYADDERYAAGEYPNQGPEEQGLPAWTKADRSLDGTDVVAWYTFGVTHVPRPEDWPVMPVHRAGFQLVPTGFFSRNPALDIR